VDVRALAEQTQRTREDRAGIGRQREAVVRAGRDRPRRAPRELRRVDGEDRARPRVAERRERVGLAAVAERAAGQDERRPVHAKPLDGRDERVRELDAQARSAQVLDLGELRRADDEDVQGSGDHETSDRCSSANVISVNSATSCGWK
jgi:hypothetical protein